MLNEPALSPISRRLQQSGPTAFSAYCIAAAFGTYFCMYAFRKPFTAGTFEMTVWGGIGFKTLLIASQVGGYTLSKFIGIKFVSEVAPRYRAMAILALIAVAEVALLLFAITPAPWNFVWLFVNGLPLGMVFGLVLCFLEGRQVTEALSAGLCASFILASGVVKTVGKRLIENWNVSEYWMPFWTGLLFVIPLLVAVWMLSQIPPPSEEDIKRRSRRTQMFAADRRAFFKRHAFGLCGLVAIYVMLTVIRSIRDDFAVEIWRDLGVSEEPNVFARSEFFVMLGVIFANGIAILIKDNRKAFLSSLALLCVGFVTVIFSVYLQSSGTLSPMSFMVLLGLGMYIPYVAFHTTVFERMIAAFREVGTIGYLMYLADAVGYLGYVVIMFLRNRATGQENFLQLLNVVSVVCAIACMVIAVALAIYYSRLLPRWDLNPTPTAAPEPGTAES